MEGRACLYHSMRIVIGKPTQHCDNRAAVHRPAGNNERRTEARVNRTLGIRSLIELGFIEGPSKPTAEMQANFLTKFMGAKVLGRLCLLVGCAPPRHGAS